MTTDGPGSTGEDSNPLFNPDQKPVEVNVSNLTDYAGHMQQIWTNSLSPTAKAFAHIPSLQTKALKSPTDDGHAAFAEGPMVQQMMQHRVDAFQAFLADMNAGLRAIANAAQVVAYCFDNTDGENGANIDQVSFAFADEGAKMPSGFDQRLINSGDNRTIQGQEEAARAAAASGPGSAAGLYGSFEGASENHQGNRWTWDDGSYMAASTTTSYVPTSGAVWTTTTYTIYDKDHKVIGTRVVKSSAAANDGSKTNQTTITRGDTKQDTSTTVYKDGSTSATTTSSAPGQQPSSTTVTTGAEDRGTGSADAGPVESATTQLGTDGGDESERNYGHGY